jgi:hypothetical protein
MFFIFKRIWLALTYGDAVVKKIREEEEKRQRELGRVYSKTLLSQKRNPK